MMVSGFEYQATLDENTTGGDGSGYDVIGIGFCDHDYIGIIPEMPSFDGKSVQMIASDEQGGGPAATAMAAAGRLGARSAFVGVVGDDDSGRFIIEDFERYGVDTSYIKVVPDARSKRVYVLVEEGTGERAFIGNDAGGTPLLESDLPLDMIRKSKFLHLDGHHLQASIRAAREAHAFGTWVVLDTNHVSGTISELLRWVDTFIPSDLICRHYPRQNPPDLARSLLDYGPRQVILTRGEQGCVAADARGVTEIPAFAVEHVVDTTGCGDVFHGAYIVGLLEGRDMEGAARFASATAALKCRAIGGRKGIPSYREVEALLEEMDSMGPV